MESQTYERLIEVGRALAAELDLDALLQRVLEVARELTGARYAAVGVLDEDRQYLERFLTDGIPEEAHAAIGDLPRGRGVLGLLIAHPEPVRVNDVGRHPESYGFPIGHPEMSSFLGMPILVDGEAWGNIYLTDKDGGPFTDEDQAAMAVLADWAAIAIANARLYRSVQARRDELERAVRGLEIMVEIAQAVGGEVELARILELVAKRARALVSARATVVALVAGDEWEVVAGAGEIADGAIGLRAPIAGSLGEPALQSLRPHRLDRLREARRFRGVGPMDADAALVVPLVFRGQALAALVAYDRLKGGPHFSGEDERLLRAFATTAATAIATGQQAANQALERSIAASERERARWARELHDETLQELAGLRLLLAATRRATDLEKVRTSLADGIERIDEGIRNLRSIITDLRPAALDQLGAQAALEALANRVEQRAGVKIELDLDLGWEAGRAGERHVEEIEETIYRVVQEAVTNAIKHAEARRITICVRDTDDGTVLIRVSDDGRGFNPSDRSTGFGLDGMRERVALVDGSMAIESRPGEGATIEIAFPGRRRGGEPELDAAAGAR
ncbi:MAG TPA: GAF domain-containing sensor histidine kinase [Baekduia sp.]|nr:GAF domain-containing sensor histidine kinase [Baekduia sp.]